MEQRAGVLTIIKRRIPNKLDLSRIIGTATPCYRVSIVLLAFSKLLSHTVGNIDGTDGLRLSDFHEAEITEKGLRVHELPTILHIRKPLSSQHASRYTYVSEEGLTYINEYLAQRRHTGDRFGPSSPLISHDRQENKQTSFVPTALIEKGLQAAIVNAGFAWKPQIFLEYFETNMNAAMRHGNITSQDLAFFLSSTPVIGSAATEHEQLSSEVLHRRRSAYNACKPYLSTVSYPIPQDSLFKESNGWIYI